MQTKIKQLDFVPQENMELVSAQVREWIRDNAFMALSERALNDLEKRSVDGLSLTLGGYVVDPNNPKRRVSMETSFSVSVLPKDEEFDLEDPEATWWNAYVLRARMQLLQHDSEFAALTRMRVSMINATLQLIEAFDERFKDTLIWERRLTKQQRDEWALNLQRDATRVKLFNAVKDAIHTTCRGMRVGSQNWFRAPDGCKDGDYELVVERKSYRINVNGIIVTFIRTA